MMISSTVLVAIIGLIGVIVSSGAGYLRLVIEKRKLAQAQLEMRFQRAALSFPEFVEEWSEISAALIGLMEETAIDRFLILRAWNGHLVPRWTTAMYQMRSANQKPVAYVHFELDTDYVSKLREITIQNSVYIETEALQDHTALKRVYEAEGITASFIAHLATHEGPVKGSKSHTYCSFATHSPELIDEAARTRCRILVSRMKGLATSFDEQPI